jgi:hypothetical protein
MNTYIEMYEKDPFGFETINKGEFLLKMIGTERRTNWITPGARHFIYADNIVIAVQDTNFEGV